MKKQSPAFVLYLLCMVVALFLGILLYVWVETRRAHPVMLDEKGRVVGQLPYRRAARA